MAEQSVDIAEVQEIIEAVEGIILIDLKGLDGTWKEHVDEIYARIQALRELCGLQDA